MLRYGNLNIMAWLCVSRKSDSPLRFSRASMWGEA